MYLRRANDDDAAKQRALDLNERIERLQNAIGSEPSVEDARFRIELARIINWQADYKRTIRLAEPLLAERFSPEIQIEARQVIADAHFRHDQYDLANQTYKENLEIAKALGSERWISRTREGIAWVLIDVGQYMTNEFELAKQIFSETLPTHIQAGRRREEGICYYGLSRSLAGSGCYSEAITYAERSIEVLESSGEIDLLQLPLLQLANVYRDDGNFDRAKPYYDLAIDASDRNQDPYLQVLVAYHHGYLQKYQHDHAGARQTWLSVLPVIQELEFPRLGAEICSVLSTLAARRSDFEEAYLLHLDSLRYGNQVGVISEVLQNQQMSLRTAMHQTGQLERTLSSLNAAVEVSEDGIFVLGPPNDGIDHNEFVIRFANPAGAQMLGRKPLEIIHVFLRTVFRSATADPLIEASREVFSSGSRKIIDPILLEMIPGTVRWYAVKLAKIPDGVAWTIVDVNEREEMRRQITAQRDRLEEANTRLVALDREKSEVLGIAAHDLRSPISNIRGLCDFMPTDNPRVAELTGIIETTADSLLVLLTNLLDIERIERGEMELAIYPLDVAPILRQIVDQFMGAAKDKQIEIELTIREDGPLVLVDETGFRRVVQNLLSNALKFSPVGGAVYVHARFCETQMRLDVRDQGKGITESDQKFLFRKFSRLSARPTGGESSTGLGLSIVKHLLDHMNGSVGCDSEAGNGATFWIQLPIARTYTR